MYIEIPITIIDTEKHWNLSKYELCVLVGNGSIIRHSNNTNNDFLLCFPDFLILLPEFFLNHSL